MTQIIYSTKLKNKRKPWQKGIIPLEEIQFTRKPTLIKRKGIDLSEKHEEIKKLFYKHCGKSCINTGNNPEDVLQEVYKGLLIRNKGRCPFDEKKSAFSTYVVMVCKCVTTNYINKTKRLLKKETIGVEDSIEKTDYAISHTCKDDTPYEKLFLEDIKKHLKGILLSIFEDLVYGHNISQISKLRGIDSRKIKNYIEKIKKILIPLGVSRC